MNKSNIKVVIMYLRVFFFRLVAVLLYSFLGATVFYYLEEQKEKSYGGQHPNITYSINNLKRRLHENISYLELNRISQDLSKLVSEIGEGNGTTKGKTDQYFNWVYFCLTTIMTIGYGDTAPKTNEGKMFLVLYGVPGISLMFLLLACFAKLQTASFRKLVTVLKINKERNNNANSISSDLTVFVLSVLFLIPVGVLGVFLVRLKTNWSTVNCLYYWFCTVTTIGFGDLVIQRQDPGAIVFWLIMKTLTLGVMAGVINSLTFLLQKRRMPKLRCSKKNLASSSNEVELE